MSLILTTLLHLSNFNKATCTFRDTIVNKGYAVSKEGCNSYLPRILFFSKLYNLPSDLIIAKVIVESGFKDNITSKEGASGLMQTTDIARRDIASLIPANDSGGLLGGMLYLKKLLNKYKNEDLALAAYNAGQGKVHKYQGIPPFKETKDHIRKIKEVRKLIKVFI